jgi:hypothetical protein
VQYYDSVFFYFEAIKIVSALYNMDMDAGLPRQMIIDSKHAELLPSCEKRTLP